MRYIFRPHYIYLSVGFLIGTFNAYFRMEVLLVGRTK